MQAMQTNEMSNPIQVKTIKKVVRPVISEGSSYDLTSESKIILLDDGNSITECSPITNCRFFPNCNKLLRVTYYATNDTNVIDGYDLPSLDEVISYYGFELRKTYYGANSPWNLPLQKISSPSLNELTAVFRRIWVTIKKYEDYDYDYSIVQPIGKVEFHDILYTINDLSFCSKEERDEVLVGAYLFCIFKKFQIRNGRVSELDRQFIDAVNEAICEIEGRNRHLASRMQQYINVASESIFTDLSDYQAHALTVRDLYEHFHP